MTNPFARALTAAKAPEPGNAAMDILKQFCDGIEQAYPARVACRLVAGFATNRGQEWRVVLEPSKRPGYQHILFRAFVPAGFPVRLDLYEESPQDCQDAQQLESALVAFLNERAVRDTIDSLAT
jgi:hypothetical protein